MSASARALWKGGESGATSVFHAFLGAICERPLRRSLTQYAMKARCKMSNAFNRPEIEDPPITNRSGVWVHFGFPVSYNGVPVSKCCGDSLLRLFPDTDTIR